MFSLLKGALFSNWPVHCRNLQAGTKNFLYKIWRTSQLCEASTTNSNCHMNIKALGMDKKWLCDRLGGFKLEDISQIFFFWGGGVIMWECRGFLQTSMVIQFLCFVDYF